IVANGYSDNILVKLFISEIVHTEDSFLLKLYYKFNFATEPFRFYKFYPISGAIRKQAEKGPVKFTISHNPYATVHSKVTKWNGRTISTKSTKNNKYKSKKYLK
ncbi:hypothetical protein RJB98_12410, partial [Staphylococcus capitis]|uniref:hypothetical protein n=1 Tax=Staphylococcus capitis TaxID=29388 RepID=UPI00287AA221